MDLMTLFADLADSWLDGTLRTLGAMQREFGAFPQDPPPVTPYAVIYEGGKLSLRHYRAVGRACSTPIVLVYPLIKRPFLLDLAPDRSVVETLTEQGFEVFLTDWLPPTSADKSRGLDAYVNLDLANGVQAVQRQAGVERVTVMGYCLGSLLTVIYSALHPADVENLVTLTLPLDMSARELPVYNLIDWLDEQAVESLTALYGNCPAWLLSTLFSAALPMQRVLSKHMGLERFSESEQYAKALPAFRRWLESEVPMAGALFRELVIDVFKKNLLVRGGLTVDDRVVDLREITCRLLNVVAESDVIVPRRASLPLSELVGSVDKSNVLFPTGHLGVALSEEAHKELWPQIGQWLMQAEN
jgi:polyhydroxyalkanoate synthase